MDFTGTFDAIYNTMEPARARVRIDAKQFIETALCAGIGKTREATDLGTFAQVADQVRCKTADIPAGKCKLGNEIEVSVASGDWVRVRIVGRRDLGGVTNLTVGASNG